MVTVSTRADHPGRRGSGRRYHDDGKVVLTNSVNSNTLTLQSGATTGNLTLTLPTADGSNGNCLKTNGSGVLSFAVWYAGNSGVMTSINTLTGVLNIVGTASR